MPRSTRMRLRRGLVLAFGLLFLVGLLSACGGGGSSTDASSTSSSTTTAAVTSDAGNGCGFAYVFESPVASNAAEQTIEKGLKKAEADFGVEIDITDGSGLQSFAENLRAAAAKECYEAIGTAFFEVGPALTEVAKEYPEQQFFIEGGEAEGPNVTNYTEAAEQGTYVAGAMAATLSKSHTIGIIDGDNSPPLKRWAAGYVAGAKSVDPNTKVIVSVVGSFTDPAKTGATAVTQAGEGADVIYPAAGSNLQVYLLGEGHSYETVGSDLGEYETAKPRHPAIAFVDASEEGNVNYAIIKQYATGEEKGSTEIGLKDHAFYIPYVADPPSREFKLPASVVAAGKKAYNDVLSGKVTVPTS